VITKAMNEFDSITQRDFFWNEIYEIAKTNSDVIIISADMGAPSLDRFRKDFPHKFLNAGISEQNAILLGAGLTLEKKRVYVYAIASFLTLNCIEKIRVQCSMMGIPLILVGVGAGLSYPDSGPTHHLIEDIAIMRAMPGIDIYNISDGAMAKALARESVHFTKPTYIRLEREKGLSFHKGQALELDIGFKVINKGQKKLIITSGHLLNSLYDFSVEYDYTLIDVFKFPFNQEFLSSIISTYDEIFVAEEHVLTGGLSSAVLEAMNDFGTTKIIKRIGINPDKKFCYNYGGREELRRYYELDKDNIIKKILGTSR
jgi:transketolase